MENKVVLINAGEVKNLISRRKINQKRFR